MMQITEEQALAIRELVKAAFTVADFLEQRSISRGDNRFPASFTWAPVLRDKAPILRQAAEPLKSFYPEG